jgi:hypothetical protein
MRQAQGYIQDYQVFPATHTLYPVRKNSTLTIYYYSLPNDRSVTLY